MPCTGLTRLSLLATLCTLLPGLAIADDWPQWMGPQRDSVWRESGIVDRFPAGGLQVRWRVPIAGGYAGPAVADGRVFVMDYVLEEGEIQNDPGSRPELKGAERVLCLDSKTGKTIWTHQYARSYSISYPAGPRCTPTVEGDRVYCLGAEGNLLCLQVKSGEVLWSKEFTKEYAVETPMWGFCAHPLIEGDLLYCVVGGEGSVAVAFDKRTGKEVWRALSASEPGYCPPTLIEHGGARQLLIWDPEKLNSLNPQTGETYWSVDLKPAYAMSVTAPRLMGDFLFASGIGEAAVLLKLDSRRPAAEVVWRGGSTKRAVYCSNSTPFLEDGVIFGSDCGSGALIAARTTDGERLWTSYQPVVGKEDSRRVSHGTVFLVKHASRYFLFSETGDLVTARLSRDGYHELDRFHVLEPTGDAFGRPVVWSHPAFAEKSLFARNDKELVCVSLAAE